MCEVGTISSWAWISSLFAGIVGLIFFLGELYLYFMVGVIGLLALATIVIAFEAVTNSSEKGILNKIQSEYGVVSLCVNFNLAFWYLFIALGGFTQFIFSFIFLAFLILRFKISFDRMDRE